MASVSEFLKRKVKSEEQRKTEINDANDVSAFLNRKVAAASTGAAVSANVNQRPVYTKDNILQNYDRANELASKQEWTDEEREEAQAIYDLIKPRPFVGPVYVGDKNYLQWLDVSNRLNYKFHPGINGFFANFVDKSGVNSIYDLLYSAAVPEDQKEVIPSTADYMREIARYGDEHAPVASGAGKVGGTIALVSSIASGVGAIKGFSSLPAIAQSIISGAASFGGATAIQQVGDVARGEKDIGEYALDIGIDAASGAVGSAAAGATGSFGLKVLQDYGLANNTLARMVVAGTSGMAHIFGRSAVSETQKYVRDPENYELDAKKLTIDALVGFAFSAFAYLTRNYTTDTTSAGKMDEVDGWAKKYFPNMSPAEAKAAYRSYVKEYADVFNYTGGTDTMSEEMLARYEILQQIIAAWTKINVDAGAAAYSAATEAQSSGDVETYTRAASEFQSSARELQAVAAETGGLTETAAEASEVLNTVAAAMIGSAASDSTLTDATENGVLPKPTDEQGNLTAEDVIPQADIEAQEQQIAEKAEDAANVSEENKNAPAVKQSGGEMYISGEKNNLPFDVVVQRLPSDAPQAVNGTESVAEYADARLGEQGKYVFKEMYSEDINANGYIDAMQKAYDAGMRGGTLENIHSNIVNSAQLKAAYFAGQADAGKTVEKPAEVDYTANEGYAALEDKLQKFDNVLQDGIRYIIERTSDGGIKEHPDEWTAARNKDAKADSARPLSELLEKIQHDLGVHITYGHVRGGGVRGQFSKADKGVRSRIAQDLPTISHEIGHWLDDRFGLLEDRLPSGVGAELEQALGELASQYSKSQIKSEGLAEFIRKFLQNKDTASIDYPKTTKYVLGSLDAKSLALLEQFADEINAYYALDADTATSAIRFREEGRPDFRTPTEKIRDMGAEFYQAWVDANHAIHDLDRAYGGNAYIYATNAAYADSVAARLISGGDLTDPDGQYVGPGLKASLHGINTRNAKEWREFGEYTALRHGVERVERGKRVLADDRKNSVAWMKKRLLELEEQYPAFSNAGTRVVEFERAFVQTWGVDTGLVSQELFDTWNSNYNYHVPLNRVIPKAGRFTGAKKGYANQHSPFFRAKGSGLDIIHPVENIINEIVTLVNAGMRNTVMLKIADIADKCGVDAALMERIPTPMVPHTFNLAGVKADLKAKVDESTITDATEIEGIIEGLDDLMIQFERGKAGGDVITVMRDGTPEYWKVNDKLLLESVTHLSAPKLNGVLEAYAKTTRFLTANITGNNPIWSIFSNAPRDLGTFAVYSKQTNPIKAIKAIGSAYVNAFNETFRGGKNVDPLFAEYLAMGGGHASAYSADADLAKKARNALTATKASRALDTINPLNWVSFISDTIEMGPRFAMYKLMRVAGLKPQEAFFEAMDVTVNFRRWGYKSHQLNKVAPFFGASTQGADKFARFFSAEDAAKGERGKTAAKRIGAFIATSAILAMLSYLLNCHGEKEKKEYQQLSNYTKNTYWCIPLGDGKYFAIPKPRELAVITSLFETCLERWEGGNEHAFDEFYEYAVDNFLPSIVADLMKLPSNIAEKGSWEGVKETGISVMGDLGLIGVGVYAAANRDFLGKPIESQSLQNLEPRDRYTQSTSKIAYWIGQGLNLSPQVIDYVGNQVLGYIWKIPRALLPVGESNRDLTLGVKNSYVKDNVYSQDLVNWLYDRAEKTKLAKGSDKENMDKAIIARNDSGMTTFYSRFNSLNKGNENTTSQRTARQTVLNMIDEYRKWIDSGEETEAQRLVYGVIRAAGETDLMPSVMNTYVKYGDEKYSLTDSQYVEYQTLYNGFYWNLAEEMLAGDHTERESIAILRQAKALAKTKADEAILKRCCVEFTSYTAKYPGIDDNEYVTFKAGLDLADDDDSLKQDEVVDVLVAMVRDGLSFEDAYTLFHSKYSSDRNNPWANYRP